MMDRDEPRMGVHFPLADFEQRIMTDPDVLGMLMERMAVSVPLINDFFEAKPQA